MGEYDVPDGVEFVQHEPCDNCGSSDAAARYSDDHVFCFSCHHFTPPQHNKKDNEVPTNAVADQGQAVRQTLLQGEVQALPARGIAEETCRRFGYQVADYRGEPVQAAVYRDDAGRPIAQKIRTRDKRFAWLGDGKQATLWGSHIWSRGKKLCIAEGELDSMALAQAFGLKYACVSLPSGAASAVKAIRQNWDYVCGFSEIILAFDMDEAGREAAQAVAEILPVGRAFIADLPAKDACEALQQGKVSELVSAVYQAAPFRPDGIREANEFRDVIAVDETESAVRWCYEGLNDKLGGIFPSTLITVLAGSGTGKTTFCKEVIYSLLMQGKRVGMVCLEESNRRTLLGLVGIHLSKNLLVDRSEATDAEVVAAFDDLFTDRTCVLLDHFGSNHIDTIEARVRYMVAAHSPEVILIDHISMLVSGNEGDDRKNLDIAMTRLRTLCAEMSVAMLLVSHLSRPSGDRGHEAGAAISLSQARGSHAIAQLSDACIGLQVDPQDPHSDVRHLRVLKNRWSGETGDAGTLHYTRSDGRLREDILALLQQEQEQPGAAHGFEAEHNTSAEDAA